MASLRDLIKPKATFVMGIDASTNSLAFCILKDGKAFHWGEINFHGSTVYERILDAKNKVRALKFNGSLDADVMSLEAAVMVRSASTGLKMAYVFGAILGELIDHKMEISEVHPITWQSFIGNKNFTKAEKEQVKKDNPGKSETWVKNKIREMRKQKTIDFVKSIGVNTDSDNVADAAGIAWYTYKNLK